MTQVQVTFVAWKVEFRHTSMMAGHLCGMESGVQAHIHDGIPFVLGEIGNWADKLDACIVVQDIQASQLPSNSLDSLLDL